MEGLKTEQPKANKAVSVLSARFEAVLNALLALANAASAKTAPKSALGKALHYLRE